MQKVKMSKNERYTLERDVRIGAWLAGLRWDATNPRDIFSLDPAACAESHWAHRWYGVEQDGLKSPWAGDIFLNPPFNQLPRWTSRIWRAVHESVNTVVYYIPGDRIEQPFWHENIEPFRDFRDGGKAPFQLDVHNMKGRAKFGYAGNPLAVNVGSPPFKMTYCIFRRRPAPGAYFSVPRLADCPLLQKAA